MSILDRYFMIFEGVDDEKYRAIAMDLYKRLLERFRTIKDSDLKTTKASEPSVTMNVGELLNDTGHGDLDMAFVGVKEWKGEGTNGKMSPIGADGKALMTLYVGVPAEALPKLKAKEWQKVMKKNVRMVFSRMREVFWHEYVHFMDLKRMAPKSRKSAYANSIKASQAGDSSYFRDPLEYNAFVQQGLMKIDEFLSGVKSAGEAKKVLGGSPSKFYQMVLKVIPYKMQQAMTDEYKNKLKKRVAQMWTSTMSRLDGDSKK